MADDTIRRIIVDIIEERRRKLAQYQDHHPAHPDFIGTIGDAYMFIAEEAGELAHVLNDAEWRGIAFPVASMRHEAIQVAAMSLAFVELLDRNTPGWGA